MIYSQCLTTLSLVFDGAHSTLQPPINRGCNHGDILVHEAVGASLIAATESTFVVDHGAGVERPELLVCHVSEHVEPELVGTLSLLVEVVDEVHIVLEHVESHLLLLHAQPLH